MANRALGAPHLTGPQPVAQPEVAPDQTKPIGMARYSPLPDTIIRYAMLSCGLCILALVGLIVFGLVTKSSLSLHAFGWKFFFQSDWDPVNDPYGALPFVYGTLVSSLLS